MEKINILKKITSDLSTYEPPKCFYGQSDGVLRNGSSVVVINPGPTPYYIKIGVSSSRAPSLLSMGLKNEQYLSTLGNQNTQVTLSRVLNSDSLNVVASHMLQPAARNVFTVESCRQYPEGYAICYGQPIVLVLEPTDQSIKDGEPPKTRLYLASDLKRVEDTSLSDGEQDVYLELNQPSFSAQWSLEAADPKFRCELEGTPVKLNERLLIRHIRTNQVLALKPQTIIRNAFGPELGVSVKTQLDPHKVERDVNVWLLASTMQPLVHSRLETLTNTESSSASNVPNTMPETEITGQEFDR